MNIAVGAGTILVLILCTPLFVLDTLFIAEVLLGLRRAPRPVAGEQAAAAVVIVPAHDEGSVITSTLQRLCANLPPRMRVLVVADNCSDDTAALARRFPVDVVERNDPHNRGKGFALAFARDWLRSEPPEVVIVIDSDCSIDRASLAALARAGAASGLAAQSVNLLQAPPRAQPMVQISTFAFLIKNLVRQRGLQRLARRVHLTGTGMCLPWGEFERSDLATSSIVEDLRLGLELAERGKPPILVEESIVWSPHADADKTLGQRERWEGGFLGMARTLAPGMLWRGLTRGSWRAVVAAVDLCIPPLALLATVNVAALVGVFVLAAVGLISWLPVELLIGIGVLATGSLGLAWWREGRNILSPGSLLRLPLYALWKLPMYAGLIRKGAPADWNRTERPSGITGEESAPKH